MISPDPAVVEDGWRELAKVGDASALRRAAYAADEAPNDRLRVGELSFRVGAEMIKRWDASYAVAFPTGSEEAAARACIALDHLAAGVMSSGPRFGRGAAGTLSDAYLKAIVTRMFALDKLTKLEPHGSAYDPKGKLAKIRAIAKSDEVANDVP